MYRIEDQHYTRLLGFLDEAQERLRNLNSQFIDNPPKDGGWPSREQHRLAQDALTSVEMAKCAIIFDANKA